MERSEGGAAGRPHTVQQIISEQARKQASAIALWWQGEGISYAALEQRVSTAAGRLAAGGALGDRVAVLAWNCPEFIELIYAVPASGRILVPLNARLAPAEWSYQLRAAGVSTLIGDAQLLELLQQHGDLPSELECIALGEPYAAWLQSGPSAALPQSNTDDPVWILYTSGSTGRPKGAVLTHRSFLAGLESAALGRPVLAGDRYFYPFPLFHVAAHNVLLQHLYGAAVVLAERFDAAETLAACRELGVTTMSLAPTMIAMLLDHPDFAAKDLATVRTIGYGASAMPETLLQRLLSETAVGLCQSYGMTELSGSIAFLTPEDHALAATERPELLKSVGRPLTTATLRLVDDAGQDCPQGDSGEIVVRAAQCMLEYWQQPKDSAEALRDGWLHTGDVGRFDDEGYLYLVDRKKDMIISGGENIASREVEEVLRKHPALRDCAVVGVPDARWGEAVAAFVVMSEQIDDAALEAHCRQWLAAYKTPKYWQRLSELPLNASAKVDKPQLRQRMQNYLLKEGS